MPRPRIAAALVAALAGSTAAAETGALAPPDLARYLRWGPLRVRPAFELREVGYDDNIFSTATNTIGDFRATLAPRVDGLVLFGGRGFLTFQERLEYTAYREYDDQNFFAQHGKARATMPFGRFGLFVDGTLIYGKERPIDQQDVRADRDERGLGFGGIFQPGWRTEIELAHARTTYRYEDPDAAIGPGVPTIGDQLDRTDRKNSLEIRYRARGRTRLTLSARRDSIDFESPSSSGRNSQAWGLVPGVDFGVGGTLSGTAQIGWGSVDAEDPEEEDFDDVVGRAELAYRPAPRLTLLLNGVREPGFTLADAGIFYLNTNTRLRAVYYFHRVLGVESGGSLGKLRFPGATGVDAREDDVSSLEAGLRFRLAETSLGRRVEYVLGARRTRTDSTVPSLSVSNTVIGLTAVVGY
jgi:hypothetical protein